MKKQGVTQMIGLFIIIAAVLLFVFFRLTQNAGKQQDKPKEQSEIEKLLSYDFENDYPKTVRDVLKLYCRCLDLVYAKETSKEDVITLNRQMRAMYAEALLNANDEPTQLSALMADRERYIKDKIDIVGYSVAEASQIVYDTMDGVEYAKLRATLNMKAGTSADQKDQTFILLKDSAGHWKIYGWVAE